METKQTYNPFPYQPLMSYYYGGGLPPQQAMAVDTFLTWMRSNAASAYAGVKREAPELLEVTAAVPAVASSLAGMGLMVYDEASGTWQDNSTDPATGGATIPSDNPITQWGKSLLDVAKSYLAYDSQKQLIAVNIRRAEQGLPPLDASTLAPQVNVGLSAQTQNLVMGAVILLGVVAIGHAVLGGKR